MKEPWMNIFFLDTLTLDADSVTRRLRGARPEVVQRLVASAQGVLRPRAVFRAGYVDAKTENGVVIDGVSFRSLVLRRSLEGIGRVFPFVMTVGEAFDRIIDQTSDLLEKYLLDEIGNLALREARRQFEDHLRSTFALENISCMTPGALEDWPIEEQKNLFSLLPGVETMLGVRLTESLLMIPRKSVSGIYFPTKVSFSSCQLCPRERCDNRKAEYDEAKAHQYGILK
jgi:Vitamin B12 dependent methionine synthase, activation domain